MANEEKLKRIEEIKIDKGIPYSSCIYRDSWPLGKMEVGDSFIIPSGIEGSKVSSAISYYSKRHPKTKFSRRGNRVWRIK